MKRWATYWALQNLGDPLLLLHHVEILPQVRRHVPAAEVLRIALIHPVKVALLGVVAGQGQGQGPRRLPHLHQTHVFTARSRTRPLESAKEEKTSPLISHSGCQGNSFHQKKIILYVCSGDSCNYWDGDKKKAEHCYMIDTASQVHRC